VPQLRVREATAENAEAIHSSACELARRVGDLSPRFEDARVRLTELLTGVASLWINTDRLTRSIDSWSLLEKEQYNRQSFSV